MAQGLPAPEMGTPAIAVTDPSAESPVTVVPPQPPASGGHLLTPATTDPLRNPTSPLSSGLQAERPPGRAASAPSGLSSENPETSRSAPAVATSNQDGPARPKRRRKKSRHIAFTLATDSDAEDEDDRRGSEVTNSTRRPSEQEEESRRGSATEANEKGSSPRENGHATTEKPEGKTEESKTKPQTWAQKLLQKFLQNPYISWIKPKLTFASLKPVIRMAISVSLSLDVADGRCGLGICLFLLSQLGWRSVPQLVSECWVAADSQSWS